MLETKEQSGDPSAVANHSIIYAKDDGGVTRLYHMDSGGQVSQLAIKENFSASAPPGSSNDISQGFEVGSLWVDTASQAVWVCVDEAGGAAVWLNLSYKYETWRFFVPGTIATGTEQGGVWVPSFDGDILDIHVYRKSTAGTSGSTKVDINIAGTTAYTTQGNRPDIPFNTAGGLVLAALPDVTGFLAGDLITMDVDQIDTGGAPSDLTVMVKVSLRQRS